MTELKHDGRATAQADSPKARRDLDWTVPNDPYFRPFEGTDQPCQWPLFLMNVPGAWEIEKGSPVH